MIILNQQNKKMIPNKVDFFNQETMQAIVPEDHVKHFKTYSMALCHLSEVKVFAMGKDASIVVYGITTKIKLQQLHILLEEYFLNAQSFEREKIESGKQTKQKPPNSGILKMMLSLFPLSLTELPF